MPSIAQQLDHLRSLGIIDATTGRELTGEGLVVVHPSTAPVADLIRHVVHADKPGFLVPDLTDIADFVAIPQVEVPDAAVYLVTDPQRGDEMANWSPEEALPAILAAGRSPMTVHEGLSWLLQEPEVLERTHCFMTIGSRKPKGTTLDRRTPAIWLSNGVERDGGTAVRGAAKVGWCWAGNRHTWLGFGSVAGRGPITLPGD